MLNAFNHLTDTDQFVDLSGTPWRWIVLSERLAVRALVDAEDHDWLCAHTWNIWHDGRAHWRIYAKRNIGRARDTVRMHREIKLKHDPDGYFDGAVVDHVNGCTLDDRDANLNWATEEQNRANVRPRHLVPSVQGIARELVTQWRCEQAALGPDITDIGGIPF